MGHTSKSVALIISHPDEETLWAGGTILSHPSWKCQVLCLSCKNDTIQAQKFYDALEILKCQGSLGDLTDESELIRLDEKLVENSILKLLPPKSFDLIITHNPSGEFTRNIRQEEISRAVIKLWHSGKIKAGELWTFAYEDGVNASYPHAVGKAHVYRILTKRTWLRKLKIITDIYGVDTTTWHALTNTRAEAFWKFLDPDDAKKWIKKI